MPPEPFNPYAPPESSRPRQSPPRHGRRWGEMAARASAVVAGFSLIADPTALPFLGHVFARGVGLAFLGLGFLPWRRRIRAGSGRAAATSLAPDPVEEL